MSEQGTDHEKFIEEFDKEHPEFLNTDGTHKLHSNWVLWTHEPANLCNKWGLESYHKHAVIKTAEQFWDIMNGFKSLVNPDMWFLMREGIPPIWEDKINEEGGSYKFKIPGDKVDNIWLNLAVHLVTENLCVNPEDSIFVSGIAVSPKQHQFSTVSIWNLDSASNDSSKFAANIPGINFRKVMYEPHKKRRRGPKN